jgi:germination protein M
MHWLYRSKKAAMKKTLAHFLKSCLFKTIIIVFLILPFLLLIFSGCGLISGLFDNTNNSNTEKTDISNSGQDEDGSIKDSSQEENNSSGSSQDETTETSSSETTAVETTAEPVETDLKIKVYYVDDQAQYLVGEDRTIKGIYKEDFINAAFNELKKKPSSSNIYNLMPEGTKILSAEYIDGYAYLNLSKEFITNKIEDSIVDFLVINCIADTITEISDINGVIFEVELEKLDVYGSLDIKSPVKRNEDIIKK